MEKVKFKQPLSSFSCTLKQRVHSFMEQQDQAKAAQYEITKACLLIAVFFVFYGLLFYFSTNLPMIGLLLTLISLCLYAIGTNVFHESLHGNLSRSKRINRWFGYGFDVIVAVSSEQYMLTHNVIHHSFTNIHGLDDDIETDGMIRLSPHQEWRPRHRFQALYAPFLYSLIFISWGPYYDVSRIIKDQMQKTQKRWSKKQVAHQLVLKLVHYSLFLLLPMLFFTVWKVLLCYLAVHLMSGVIVTMIFQVAHVNGQSQFLKLNKQDGLHISENDYYVHQLLTSASFATHSRFMNTLSGGLNFQTEHHLFPNISYYFYPQISKIVKETCAEFDLPYVEFSSFSEAAWAHLKLLNELGVDPNKETLYV